MVLIVRKLRVNHFFNIRVGCRDCPGPKKQQDGYKWRPMTRIRTVVETSSSVAISFSSEQDWMLEAPRLHPSNHTFPVVLQTNIPPPPCPPLCALLESIEQHKILVSSPDQSAVSRSQLAWILAELGSSESHL